MKAANEIPGGQKIATEEKGKLESLNVAIFLTTFTAVNPFKIFIRKFLLR